MTEDPRHIDDRQVWERRGISPPPGPCPDANDLAGYLDGRLDEASRAGIEAHLAACEACLDAVVAIRLDGADAAPAGVIPPAAVVAAAKSLVPAAAASTAATRVSRPAPDRWRLADLLGVARWGFASAASIAICIIAYRAGLAVSTVAPPTESSLVGELSFGVFDTSESEVSDIELIAMLAGEVSP
jgi:hypothetical protein